MNESLCPVYKMKASLTLEAALVIPVVTSILLLLMVMGMFVVDHYCIMGKVDRFAYAFEEKTQGFQMMPQEAIHASQLSTELLMVESGLAKQCEDWLRESLEGKLFLTYDPMVKVELKKAVVGTQVNVAVTYQVKLGPLAPLCQSVLGHPLGTISIERSLMLVKEEEWARVLAVGKALVKNTSEVDK